MHPWYSSLMQFIYPEKKSTVPVNAFMNVRNLISTESFEGMGLEVLIINYTDPKVNSFKWCISHRGSSKMSFCRNWAKLHRGITILHKPDQLSLVYVRAQINYVKKAAEKIIQLIILSTCNFHFPIFNLTEKSQEEIFRKLQWVQDINNVIIHLIQTLLKVSF